MSCRRRMSGFNYESELSERTPRFAPHRCRMANGTYAPLLRNDRTVSGGHPKHRRTRQTERTKTPTNIPPSRRFGNRPVCLQLQARRPFSASIWIHHLQTPHKLLFTIHFQRNLSSASCLVLVKKTQFGITVGIVRHGR